MNTIEIAIPFQKRHLQIEIKQRGGKFQAANKTWALPDNEENRQLAALIQKPISGPTPEERVTNVATTAIELLNQLKHRKYRLVESGNRILIESDPIADRTVEPTVTK